MSPSATAVEAVQRGDAGAAAQADLHRRSPRRGKYHSKSNAAGRPRRGLLLISVGEESLPDEPTGGPIPKGMSSMGTPIGKPSAIGEPPYSPISSRARPYNSSCFLPSHLHHQNNLLTIKHLQVKAKRPSPFTCLHQHPTSVKAVKAKNTPYCVVYTRARTNKRRQYAPTCPTPPDSGSPPFLPPS